MQTLLELVRNAPRVYIIGNGGSFANAIHIANDLLSRGVRAFTMDIATFSAFANDHGYYQSFKRWIEVVGEPDDLLIALSGSGKSPNILIAVEAAQKRGMKVWTEYGAAKNLGMQDAEEEQVRMGHDLYRGLA